MKNPFEDEDAGKTLSRSLARSTRLLADLLDQVAASALAEMGGPLPDSHLSTLRDSFVLRAIPLDSGSIEVALSSRFPKGELSGIPVLNWSSVLMEWPLPSAGPASLGSDTRPSPDLVKEKILMSLFRATEFSVELSDRVVEEAVKRAPVLDGGCPLVRDIGYMAEDVASRHVRRALRAAASDPELERLYGEVVAACEAVPAEERLSAMEDSRRHGARAFLERAVESAMSLLTEEDVSEVFNLARVRSVIDA